MTDTSYARALALLNVDRPDLAEPEVRRALAISADDGRLHALLSLCLTASAKTKEAIAEAHVAVGNAPDMPISHLALANAYLAARRTVDAGRAAEAAAALFPDNVSVLSSLSAIRLDEGRVDDADDLARRALAIDPHDRGAQRALAFVLVRRGRLREAATVATQALSDAPEDADAHVTLGYALLHHARYEDAMACFREALRLDPQDGRARAGFVEALKASRGPYGVVLRIFLWESRLSTRMQWAFIVGVFPVFLLWGAIASVIPVLAVVIAPIPLGYLLLALLSWVAEPLSDLTIRLHPIGRHALTPEERLAADLVGVCLVVSFASLGVWAATRDMTFFVAALFVGMLMIPIGAVFQCPSGWRRLTMAGYVLMLVGFLVTTGVYRVVTPLPTTRVKESTDPDVVFPLLFLFGWKFSTWIATALRLVGRRA